MLKVEMFRNEDRYDEFKGGRTIFKEGDQGGPMYVVVEGGVTLSAGGRELERLGPGGVFGEMALLDSESRSATAVATSDCKLTPIDQKRFTYLVQQTPHFALQIMRIMAERLRRMDQRLGA
jgi:CRP/FNR family transcriptional regulator, cyclic AMP receptor protein